MGCSQSNTKEESKPQPAQQQSGATNTKTDSNKTALQTFKIANITNSLCESKSAKVEGLCPLIAQRWSPRSFEDISFEVAGITPDANTIIGGYRLESKKKANEIITEDLLDLMLKAGSWAASAYNEQPWRFLIGTKTWSRESYDKILSCLVE